VVAVEEADSGRSLSPFKAASPRESDHAAVRGRDPSLRAIPFEMVLACAEISDMKESLRRRAAQHSYIVHEIALRLRPLQRVVSPLQVHSD